MASRHLLIKIMTVGEERTVGDIAAVPACVALSLFAVPQAVLKAHCVGCDCDNQTSVF